MAQTIEFRPSVSATPTINFIASRKAPPYYAEDPKLARAFYCNVGPTLEKLSAIDVCFMCDITGDMTEYQNLIYNGIEQIIEGIERNIKASPRVAFIGFRDIEDGKNQIAKHDFTTNIKEIKEFIKEQKCFGGGDVCEDIVKPMMEALKLDWRSDLMYVYLLLEAPTHGKIYHLEGIVDNYLDAYKKRMVEKLACHYRKSRINLVIIRCNSTVDMTIEVIKKYYESIMNKLTIIDISEFEVKKGDDKKKIDDGGKLASKIKKAFDSDLFTNFRKSIGLRDEENDVPDDFKILPVEFTCQVYFSKLEPPLYRMKLYDYKFSIEPKLIAKCNFSTTKISSGAYSGWAYMEAIDVKSINSPEKIKEEFAMPIVEEDKEKDEFRVTQNFAKGRFLLKSLKNSVKSAEEIKHVIEGNALASHFILNFNQLLGKGCLKIIPMWILELTKDNKKEYGDNSRAFIAQPYIKGTYTKFNNNYGEVWDSDEENNQVVQAFSHFTYEFSLGTLIMIDIQGIVIEDLKILISNPSIHSALYKDLFTETNHGKIGIMKFFQTHKCNQYCKSLLLTDPTKIEKDTLSKIMAEREASKILPYLYEKFEDKIAEWRKQLKSFNPKEKPAVSTMTEKDISEAGFEGVVSSMKVKTG